MKIRTQSKQLINMNGRTITTLHIPDGSYQILAYTKDKKEGTVLGEYSTEEKTIRVLNYIQFAATHPKQIGTFRMPLDTEVPV